MHGQNQQRLFECRGSPHITAPVMNSFQILSASQKDSDWLVAQIFFHNKICTVRCPTLILEIFYSTKILNLTLDSDRAYQ